MNETVPFIVHESILARMERTIKRLWLLCIIMFAALVISNIAWMCYESSFNCVEAVEVRQLNDIGNNNYIGNDGEIYNGSSDN